MEADATLPQTWEQAGLANASAVVITVREPAAGLRICELVRSLAPDVKIAIRTRHLSEAFRARQVGADFTIVEEIEAANAMAALVPTLLNSHEEQRRHS